MQSFGKRFQAKKLDRVAATYAVAGWLFVQAAAIILPTFGAPSWPLKALILVTVLGFPAAMWIAWQMAPHRPTRRAQADTSRTDIALISLLATVIIVSLVQFAYEMGFRPLRLKPLSSPGGAAISSVTSTARTSPEGSIAVLPFLNMSGDPGKDYFSDGVTEELLNDLANASNLRVAARTSSFAFKGKNEDIRTIAHALSVGAIVEGSVREDGEHVRITAQLIDAANGYHLWSKTYDRNLSNILSVQDEIARAITGALTHRLLARNGAGAKARSAPIDPTAYRDYLEARSFAARKTDDGDTRALALFQAATALQPDLAAGFAGLGRLYIHMAEFHNQRPDLLVGAEEALGKALALDPNNLEAVSSRLVLMLMKENWQAASDDARRLSHMNSHNVFTLRSLYFYYGALGFPQQQADALREAMKLDPLSFVDANDLAILLNDNSQFPQAIAQASKALARSPGRPIALYTLCVAYAGAGRLDKARTVATALAARHATTESDGCALKIALASGEETTARALANRIAGSFPAFPFGETDIGIFFAANGQLREAMDWLDRAYDHRDGDLFALPYRRSTPPALLQSAGWKALMERPDAIRFQAAHAQLAQELAHAR